MTIPARKVPLINLTDRTGIVSRSWYDYFYDLSVAPAGTGEDGAQGIPGRDGEDGQDGFPGVAGQDGAPGATGAAGAIGPPGQPGSDGEDGPMGFPGQQGATGPAGADGIIGYTIRGEDGQDGENSYIPGPMGPTGPAGADGAGGGGSVTYLPAQDGEDGRDGFMVASSTQSPRTIGMCFDGGGSPPTVGSVGYIVAQFTGTIIGWSIVGDASGSAVVDVWKAAGSIPVNANAIAGSEKLTLSAQQLASDNALTTWSTTVLAGDVLAFEIESVSTCTRLTCELSIQGA